jgi:hypothetical protein
MMALVSAVGYLNYLIDCCVVGRMSVYVVLFLVCNPLKFVMCGTCRGYIGNM